MPAFWTNEFVHELQLVMSRATCAASALSMTP